jgi:hypothetical protein
MHFFFIKHKGKGLDDNNSILALKICILFIPIKELCVCVCMCLWGYNSQASGMMLKPTLWVMAMYIHYLPSNCIISTFCETLLFGFLSLVAQKISRGKCNSFYSHKYLQFTNIWEIYCFITKLQLHVSVSACMSIIAINFLF